MTTSRTPATIPSPWPLGIPASAVGNSQDFACQQTPSSSAIGETTRRDQMTPDKIAQNMEVIGADGVHIGTVDGVTNGRIRLTKRDSGEGKHQGSHAFHRPRAGRRRRREKGPPLGKRGGGGDVRRGAVGRACLTREARRPKSRVAHKIAPVGDNKADSRRMPHAKNLSRHRKKMARIEAGSTTRDHDVHGQHRRSRSRPDHYGRVVPQHRPDRGAGRMRSAYDRVSPHGRACIRRGRAGAAYALAE